MCQGNREPVWAPNEREWLEIDQEKSPTKTLYRAFSHLEARESSEVVQEIHEAFLHRVDQRCDQTH